MVLSAFLIARTEVTWVEWREVLNWAAQNGYTDLSVGAGKADDHPVQNVSWWDVVKWLNAKSEKQNRTRCYYADSS